MRPCKRSSNAELRIEEQRQRQKVDQSDRKSSKVWRAIWKPCGAILKPMLA